MLQQTDACSPHGVCWNAKRPGIPAIVGIVMAILALSLLGIAGFIAAFVLAFTAVSDFAWNSRLKTAALLAAAIGAVVFVVLAYRTAGRLFRKLGIEGGDTDCGDGNIYFQDAQLSGGMTGQGRAAFQNGVLVLSGRLSPDASPFRPAALVIRALSVVGWSPATHLATASKLDSISRVGDMLLQSPEHVTVLLDRNALAKVTCTGPEVRLKLRGQAACGLVALRFYVHSAWRTEFFRSFDAAFPGMLPARYHADLERLNRPASV